MKYDEFYYGESATPVNHKQYILYGSKDNRGYHLATFESEEIIALAVEQLNRANKEEEIIDGYNKVHKCEECWIDYDTTNPESARCPGCRMICTQCENEDEGVDEDDICPMCRRAMDQAGEPLDRLDTSLTLMELEGKDHEVEKYKIDEILDIVYRED